MKCDCGESDKPHHPKEKCIHLREAEERARAGYSDEHSMEKDPLHLAAVAEEQGCCCHHGGNCSCAVLKKETDEIIMTPHGPAVKPRLEKTNSDGAITVFTNGHHKPVHRKNHAAHECGMPYKMPMPRAQTDQSVSTAARRSVDSLALDSNMPYQPSAFTPQTSAPFNTERRKSKSEQHSPKLFGIGVSCSGLGDDKLASIDFSSLSQTQTNQSMQSAASETFGFPSLDPMTGVNDGSFDPWSAFPSSESTSMPNNNPFSVWPTSNDNTNIAQPALTAASSGTQSEIDEIPPMEDVYGFAMPSIQEDVGNFGSINMASSTSPQSNRRSLPPGFFGNMDLGLDGLTSEWQPPLGSLNGTTNNKSRTQQDNTSMAFNDPWQMPALQQIASVPQRQLGGLPNTSRPQSRSVGPGSAPSDDIIGQLFPDMDITRSIFDSANSPQGMNNNTNKANATSAPMDFGPMDTSVGFTSRPWSDGSMSIPNDNFTTSYDMDHSSSSPDFSGDWSQ